MALDQEYVERAVRSDPSMGRAVMAMLVGAIKERSLVWVALLGAVGLFTYAAIAPTYLRWGVTATYCVSVLWPLLWKRGG